MPHTLVRHIVKDYDAWRRVFDENTPNRQDYGLKKGVIFRNMDQVNELLILMEWDEEEKARQFFGTAELREVMERAGVTDEPDIYFLEKVDEPAL